MKTASVTPGLYDIIGQVFDPSLNPFTPKIGPIPAMRMVMVEPQVEDAECVEVIERAEVTTDDYDRTRHQIEVNNPGEGCMSFCESYSGKGYDAEVAGTMWRESTMTGDGHFTPREEVEKIEINIESFRCYNACGDLIPSDFDCEGLQ